jgi:hypothetical protein
MLKRDRLTQTEYDAAIATPLVFSKDGIESEEDCMKRVKKAIKGARPTNPLAARDHDKDVSKTKDGKDKKDKLRPDHADHRDHRGRPESHHRREDKLPI